MAFLVLGFTTFFPARAAVFDHAHSALDRTLKAHVTNGLVNYRALKADSKGLDGYLDQCATVTEAEYLKWSEGQRLAFCINLYNAATLRLVLDHYPVTSIKKIGNWFRGPWKEPAVRLFGKTTTLHHLEYEVLREQFDEPRLHFAIVCAARGCPVLRDEAYTAEKMERQLDEQGRAFLGDTARNRVDVGARTAYLSPIFKWFEEDFARGAGSVPRFIANYYPPGVKAELDKGGFRIKYTEYDWSLNDAASK